MNKSQEEHNREVIELKSIIEDLKYKNSNIKI
jgi:hypothetical protein